MLLYCSGRIVASRLTFASVVCLQPGTRTHMRTPEPGYVLCISCPAAAVVHMGRNLQQQIEVGFSNSNLTQLSDLLQQACGSAWGEMPSSWKKATASTAKDKGQHRQMAEGQNQDRMPPSNCPGLTQFAKQLKPAPLLLPVHGLQLSSVSRSLACIKVQPQVFGCQHHVIIYSLL